MRVIVTKFDTREAQNILKWIQKTKARIKAVHLNGLQRTFLVKKKEEKTKK